jgi:hypothetical protein
MQDRKNLRYLIDQMLKKIHWLYMAQLRKQLGTKLLGGERSNWSDQGQFPWLCFPSP